MISRRTIVLVLATALAAASVIVSPGAATGATVRVRAMGSSPADFHFMPKVRRITKGDRVRWKNVSTATHKVTAYSGRWSKDSSMAPGEITRHRFRRTGRYKYRCTIPGHSDLSSDGVCTGMCGVVRVRRS